MEPSLFHKDERAYLLGLGVRSLVWVPLVLRDRLLGALTIRLTNQRRLLEEDLELIQALAGQAAVALDLARLAEEAKQAVVAKGRSEAVERTAETLRLSLDLLAEEPELGRFLGHVLRAANARLNVRHSTLWLHDPDLDVNRLHMTCRDGRIAVDPVDAAGQAILSRPRDFRAWPHLIEHRAPLAFDDAPNNPDIPEVAEAMRTQGVRSLLVVPLMLGAEILGVIGLHNTERESWTEDEVNLARALGHQATLSLHMTRLATKARESAILEERNRLAREIHDTLAQGFAAIRMQLDLARGDPGLPAEAAQALEFAHQIAGENLVEARRSMAVLKSAQPSLGASLSAAIEGVRRLGQIRVVAQVGATPEPPPEVSHELVRIGQEAMLNAVRHAEASTLRISLGGIRGGGVQLVVADDGKGFDPTQVRKGFGLAGLCERAAAINAELAIISEPGGGAEVIATWAPT
jgi:signal transduction histidine kinase